MKKKALAPLVLIAVATMATAGILGILVNSQMTTSVTGKLVYKCTYSVSGQYTTVVLDNICPPSMQFE
jgi:hypothetical protein